MQKNSKTIFTWGLSLIGIFIVLFILGTFLDEKISQTLYKGETILDIFFDIIGKMPAFILAGLCCILLIFSAYNKQNKLDKYLMLVVWTIGSIVCFSLAFLDLYEWIIEGKKAYAFAILTAIVLTSIFIFVFSKSRIRDYEYLKKWAIYTVMTIAIVFVFTYVLKMVFNRARYEDVVNGNAVFTAWYQKGVEGESFPSGHTSLAACLIVLVPLTNFVKKLNQNANLMNIGVFLYVVIIMLSRIVMGKHYLTDTAISALIAFIVAYILQFAFFGKDISNISIKEKGLFDLL